MQIKRKVLVVDDSLEARSAIERVLLRAGYEVIPINSGREALYILKQRKVDCVLLDHLMPDLDGLEVLRIVKADPELKIIPIIMLTALDSDDAAAAGLNAGADDYVLKTASPEILLARVESMMRLGKLQRDLFEKNIVCEQANVDLRKLDTLKSDFISTVSHELRTPLSITKEGLNLVLEGTTGSLSSQQKELLEVARNNIERLGRIISDILDISKIEAGKLPLHKSVVDMGMILRDLFSFYKNTVEQKGIEFNIEAPASGVYAYADEERITQVITNLISNAIKFTNEGGRITLRLKHEERELVCSIEDAGIGIAESDLNRIFEKFQQLTKVYGPGEKGTGLGLSIAKKIIEMHKGRIWAKSRLGEGSEFYFSLPRYSEEEILREHIKGSIEEAKERVSKFTMFILELIPCGDRNSLEAFHDCVKKIMRRPIDTTVIYKNKIIIFLLDINKDNVQVVKRRIIEASDSFICTGKDNKKKVNLTFKIVNYPENVLSEDDFMKKIMEC